MLTVQARDQRYQAGPGSLAWLPRGVPDTYASLSDTPVRTAGAITPPGLKGLFAMIAAYFAGLTSPPDPETLIAINAKYGVRPADNSPLIQHAVPAPHPPLIGHDQPPGPAH